MGLDMYLVRKTSIMNYDNHKYTINISLNGQPVNINPDKVSEISEEIGYWRKANAIHKWFVDNVQDGKDDCGSYYVSKEKLQQLLHDCEDVLEDHSKAKDLLPVSSGFFFGSYEYDDWYFDSLHQTVKICQEAIKLMEGDLKYSSFYYHASW